MQKQTLIIVINDLREGGAEILLVGLLPALNEKYNIILVTLTNQCEFSEDKIICEKKYSLGFTGNLSIFRCAYKLNKIIRKNKAIMVHSHLFYSNIISRLACPASVPCLNTLHGLQSYEIFNKSKIWTLFEKLTIQKYHSILAVSPHVLEDYENVIKKIPQSFVLANFAGCEFFTVKIKNKNFNAFQELKLVAVGNIKSMKNHIFLIEAFKKLKAYNISLDIYGADHENLLQSFQKIINDNDLPIQFKGKSNNIYEVLPQYDIYVMPSKSEGCSVAVLEAMVLGLPLLLSNLPGLEAETKNNALFFNIADQQSFLDQIKGIFERKYDLNAMSAKGILIGRENYTKEIYLKKLFDIYTKILN